MGPWPWRGAWTALVRCGRTTYTAPVLPRGRILPEQAVGVADGSGFMADLSTLKVNFKLVSRAGPPVPANGPSESRLVEAALAARCGDKGPTCFRRYAALFTLARRDQIPYKETMPWSSPEAAVNLGGGGSGGDGPPYNCPAMVRASKEDEVLSEDHFLPEFGGLKVLFEDLLVPTFDIKSLNNNLKSRSLILSTVCSPSRLLRGKLVCNLHEFLYSCNLADPMIMNAGLCYAKQFNKLDLRPLNFDSSYGATLVNEVKCWQIRCLTKALQASGAIHTDFKRGFICAEDMVLDLSDASKGSTKYIHSTVLKLQVHDPLVSILIYQKKLLNKMFSSCHFLSQLECYRFFSSRKQRKFMNQVKEMKARNRAILCLDDGFDEVLLNFIKTIAQMRQHAHDYGKLVDVSERYGPGCEVYTAAAGGSFHVTFQHCNKLFDMSFSARDLYSRAWRSQLGTFVMQPDHKGSSYISNEDHKTLTFTGSYTYGGLGGDNVKDTWIGVDALRHAFHVIYKSDGSPTDLLKQAIKIISIHLSESARLQSVYEAVCDSMTDVMRTTLDVEPESVAGGSVAGAARPIRTHTPSFWVANYGHYSYEGMFAIDKYISENKEYSIENVAVGQVKSAEEIFREIRVLSRDAYRSGLFADKVGDPPLEPPRESPPDVTGYEVESPYLLLNEWGTGMSR